jgi:hypothetical protein
MLNNFALRTHKVCLNTHFCTLKFWITLKTPRDLKLGAENGTDDELA